jgi:hypothetical protein
VTDDEWWTEYVAMVEWNDVWDWAARLFGEAQEEVQ